MSSNYCHCIYTAMYKLYIHIFVLQETQRVMSERSNIWFHVQTLITSCLCLKKEASICLILHGTQQWQQWKHSDVIRYKNQVNK